MDQNRTAQLKRVETAAADGVLTDYCWLAFNGRRKQGAANSADRLWSVPIVLQPDLYRPVDWRDWFDLSRLLAELLCRAVNREDRAFGTEITLAQYSKLVEQGLLWTIWALPDEICPNCAGITAFIPVFSAKERFWRCFVCNKLFLDEK